MTAKAKNTANATTKSVEEAVNVGQEAWRSFFTAGTVNYEKIWADARDQWGKSTNGYDDFTALNKDNAETAVEVASAYSKGIEAISAEWFAFSKSVLDANVKATQDIFAAGTLQEVIELQNHHAKANLDGWVAQGTKLGEMPTELAQTVAKPVNARVNATVEKMTKAAA